MLNPSNANAFVPDPTMIACEYIAKNQGFSGFGVINLHALKSSDRSWMFKQPNRDGLFNPIVTQAMLNYHNNVCVAWGTDVRGKADKRFLDQLKTAGPKLVWCLGQNRRGRPYHPMSWVPPLGWYPWSG